MQELLTGIHRLRAEEFRSSHALFQLPASGQPAGVLLVTCSEIPLDAYSLIPINFTALQVLQNFWQSCRSP
jgi:hypothetical protein